jgi:YcxB-like protein
VYDYEGTLTEADTMELERLRTRLLAGPLFIVLEPLARFHTDERGGRTGGVAPGVVCRGTIGDVALETELTGVETRIPWKAVTTYIASDTLLVIVIGHVYLPIPRHFFKNEEAWTGAKAVLAGNVLMVEPQRTSGPEASWRTVALWLTLLAVIFMAWHFAQVR